MRIGIGLPTSTPGTTGAGLLEWARRAEDGPFSSLGVVDRLRYESYEPMTTLAACAAATEEIGLVTMVVIAPLRNGATLAKEAATLDALSGGRLTLGVAVGARTDDYEAAGQPSANRGDRLDDQLAELRACWERDEVGRLTATGWGPRLLVGGSTDRTYLRVARSADGYVHGGGPPKTFQRAADQVRTAWNDLGRAGAPALWAQAYFALGDDAQIERAKDYMRDYYAFTGPFAERIAQGLLTTPQAIGQFIRGYAEAGCDELVLLPAIAELDQLERLGAIVQGSVT